MDNYVNIVNNRIDDLIKISINERKEHGIGILFLNFCNKEKMDVFYIPLHNKEKDGIHSDFPKDLIEYFTNKIKEVPKSVIFFNIYDDTESLNMELDLEKNSDYTNYCLNKLK